MAEATISVRLASTADLRAILDLYRELAEDRAASLPAEGADAEVTFSRILATVGRTILVAESEADVVGTADLVIVDNLTHDGAPWAIIENVVVTETCRGRGVGRSLMTAIEGRCRAAGCYKVQLLSRNHREDAHAFYRALGFEESALGFRKYLD
jgi:GNAT superfamily N-acetyltransferase